FDEGQLKKAELWMTYVLNNFLDSKENFFHFSSQSAEQLIAKKKEVFDNVIPSSNSVMARNLFRLGTLLDKNEWKQMSVKMVLKLSAIIVQEPVYMSNWGILFSEITEGMNEVVIVGEKIGEMRKEIQSNYFPFALFLGTKFKSNLPLFEGREVKEKTMIYVCKNKVCQFPVENIQDAINQMISA
ncbi:MAG TPA: thioredoxin domain-containing protein, partial [Cyclobacteriaceae bacterium]|nr:thioredoxin domain-containing protein [Cyclobacteriaceae bacterium]